MRRTIGILSFLVGTLLVIGVNALGLWYLTLLVGLIIGLLPLRSAPSVLISILVGLCGWGLSLWTQVGMADIGPASGVISMVMGFGKSEWVIPVVVTLVVGLLLSLAGTWFGRAVHSMFASPSYTERYSSNMYPRIHR